MTDSEGCFADVTAEPLSLKSISDRVSDPAAGAIATFSGVTRNSFEGREVTKLEYEAYVPMAIKLLKEICIEAKRRWGLTKAAVVHRTGTVTIGEASVMIAVSSAHRKASLEACSWMIDELKAVVPIWKKEFFTDGSVWKENAESRRSAVARN